MCLCIDAYSTSENPLLTNPYLSSPVTGSLLIIFINISLDSRRINRNSNIISITLTKNSEISVISMSKVHLSPFFTFLKPIPSVP